MKKYGLFIGIDRYRKLGDSNHLHCAGSDALALAAAFRDKLGFTTAVLQDVDLGYADDRSHEVIFDKLNEWEAALSADDETLLVLYFAGHGTTVDGQQFLLAPKAPAHALANPAVGQAGIISEVALLNETERWPKVKRVFIFDACRTELGRQEDTTALGGRAIGMGRLREQGRAMLRACPPDQVAFELRNYGEGVVKKSHGLYTAALLDLIDQRVTLEKILTLDDGFNQEIARLMNGLVQRFATAADKISAGLQRPSLEGAEICLVTGEDFAALRIQRLLAEFEVHFAAGRFHSPLAECCGNIIVHLQMLKHSAAAVLVLSSRIVVAEQQKENAEKKQRGERLMASARETNSLEKYQEVRDAGFTEYESEYAPKIEKLTRKRKSEQDEAEWVSVQLRPSLAAYREYLSDFPEGAHVAQAQAAIAGLEEDAEWQAAQHSSQGVSNYCTTYPNGRYIQNARELRAVFEAAAVQLRQAEMLRQDEVVWAAAMQQGKTRDALEVLRQVSAQLKTEAVQQRCAQQIAEIEEQRRQAAQALAAANELAAAQAQAAQEKRRALEEAAQRAEQVAQAKAKVAAAVEVAAQAKIKANDKFIRAIVWGGIVCVVIGIPSFIYWWHYQKTESVNLSTEAASVSASQEEPAPPASAPLTYAAGQIVSHPLKDGSNGPEMVVVPAGNYWMGAGEGESAAEAAETPQHKVTIGYDFAVGKYEVTKGQFAKFVKASGYKTEAENSAGCVVFNPKENKFEYQAGLSWQAPGFDGSFKQDDTHPVVCVSWNDAKAYVAWLSAQTGKTYRLLSEAEWEYAARGEKAGEQASKSVPWAVDGNFKGMCDYANGRDERLNRIQPGFVFSACDDGYEYTAPVGKKRANAFGLYDMHGNVWEWTEDCFHDTYNLAPVDGSVWAEDCQKDVRRVLRGGSWYYNPSNLRSAYRFRIAPMHRDDDSGLRVAWTLP
jgi:formylglycine-generating enzyme required for sulfatase activity